MSDNLIRMQVLFEIGMAIGRSFDLPQMLRQALSAYLHKLNCSAGMVFQAENHADLIWEFTPVFTMPRHADRSAALKAAFERVPFRLKAEEFSSFYESLPLTGELYDDKRFYLMLLPDFGLLLLVKAGRPFDEPVLKSLVRLNDRLAESCLACLQKQEVDKMIERMRSEISDRLRVEGRLREVLDNLEARVAARTRDLLETNQRLEEALADVRTLSGLLPICSVCKKIRDDQGYWNQIDSYITEHSDAVFSHGLCPECFGKLYPELTGGDTGDKAG